jgi:2-keto-4-pentenoate hydratase
MSVTPDYNPAAAVMFAAARSGHLDPAAVAAFDALPPGELDGGLAVQLAVLGRWEAAGEALGGWKIGLTSRGGRDSMGPGFRPFGYLLASRILGRGAKVSAADGHALEPEIGLTIGSAIGGEVTAAEARAAVRSVHPAFEILQRRVTGGARTPLVRLADGLGQWGVVFGPGVPPGDSLAGLTVELLRDGVLVGAGGAGPEVIDDPYQSVARVCRELARHGQRLEPGQRVITGSLLDPVPLSAPAAWEGRFGGLGTVSLQVVDEQATAN